MQVISGPLVLALMEYSPGYLIKHKYAKGLSCCLRSLLTKMSRLERPYFRICHSDFVGYNVKVVEALLPHPPLPSSHIYRRSEGVGEWHTSPARVINMTLRHK